MIKNIKNQIKEAMKSKDFLKRDILRLILANAMNIAKADGNREVSEEDCLTAIKRQVKRGKETIEFAKKEGRDTSKEEKEIEILNSFLPLKVNLKVVEGFIEAQIIKLKNEGADLRKSIGRIMGLIKKEFGDSIEMGDAKKILDKKMEEN